MPSFERLASATFVVLALVFTGARAQAQATIDADDDPLVGLWSNETVFGPTLRGELEIQREGAQWHAALAGAQVRSAAAGNEVRFSFPGKQGGFRGSLSADGSRIAGFWLQPTGETEDRRDPGGSGQAFATPLELRRAGRNTWVGGVQPLQDRFTLYLRIFRNPDGALTAAFRNPDLNSNGGASHFRVTHEGSTVLFTARRGDALPEIRHAARLLDTPERIRIAWPDLGRAVELVRRLPAQAGAFFPRPPGEPSYAYRRPAVTEDGWHTRRAGDTGLDEADLARLVQRLIDADPSVRRPALIHSLLVARRGQLVLEEYFFGFDRDTPHDMRSAGKTFASVMLGAALREGVPLGPQTPAYALLAGRGPFANPDPRKAQITLAHLLTHTSGLACDDNDDASPGNEGTMQSQRGQPDWWKYTLDLPMAHEPGSRYAYCSANINLVGAALTTATGTWLPEYFERAVARPLRFGRYHWNLMPTGEGYLGGGAFVRPRDLLKIGQAYLDGGVWRGQRIVDAAWVTRSTAQYVEITEATTGLDAERFPEFYNKGADGYAWHLGEVRSGDRSYREYEASGNGGQLLIVVPQLELAVVFTAGNYLQGGIWGRFRDEIVAREIIAAIRP